MHNKYFITKPTKLYCIQDFNFGSSLYYKNNIYTVSIYLNGGDDDDYFIINNNTNNQLIFAKTSLTNKYNLKDFFVDIKEERKQKLNKLLNISNYESR